MSTLDDLNSELGDLGKTPVAFKTASTTKTILLSTHCGSLAKL